MPMRFALRLFIFLRLQYFQRKDGNVSSRAARMLNDGGFLSSGDPKEQADLKGE